MKSVRRNTTFEAWYSFTTLSAHGYTLLCVPSVTYIFRYKLLFVCFIKVKLYFVYKKKKLLFVLIIKVKHSHVKMLENTDRQNF